MNDRSVREGEDLTVMIMIVNDSHSDLVINNRLLINDSAGPHELAFDVWRGKERVEFLLSIREPWHSTDFTLLRARQFLGRRANLARYYRLPKGQYTVSATYSNQDDPPRDTGYQGAWKGETTSNQIKFKVT